MSRKAKTYLIIIGGALALLIGIPAWLIFGPPRQLQISQATTHLTEPLTAEGQVDYVEAVVAPRQVGISAERNGAIPLIQATWPCGMKLADLQFVCRELKIDPPAREGLQEPMFSDAWDERVTAWASEKWKIDLSDDEQYDFDPTFFLEDIFTKPWKRADYPPAAQWADDQAESLAILHEMTERDQFYFPNPNLAEQDAKLLLGFSPSVQLRRICARCLLARSMMYVGEGEPALAWRDLRLIFFMSRISRPRMDLTDVLINYALEDVALAGTQQLLSSDICDDELLTEMSAYLADLPPQSSVGLAIDDYTRWMLLEFAIKTTDPEDLLGRQDDLPGARGLMNLALDKNAMLQRLNQRFDQIAVLTKLTDPIKYEASVAQFYQQISDDLQAWNHPGAIAAATLSQSVRGVYAADLMFSWAGLTIAGSKRAEFRTNASEQLIRVAIELEKYRLANGQYPDTLSAIAGQLDPALLQDPYSAGEELLYEPRDDGGYLLYSRYSNGADDLGTSQHAEILEGDWAKPDDPVAYSDANIDLVLRFPLPPPPTLEKPLSEAEELAQMQRAEQEFLEAEEEEEMILEVDERE